MPDCVLEKPYCLEDIHFKYSTYDMIILGYQPWFLSPSIPTTSLFHYAPFLDILKDTPIVTIIGARNMWLNAQESIKKQIFMHKGKLIANIPFIDKSPNILSVITIFYWLSTGKKDRKWRIFPLPGISDYDIKGASEFGKVVTNFISRGGKGNLQQKILNLNKIKINKNLLFIELKAKKSYLLWAKILDNKVGVTRRIILMVFRFYLNFALFIISPIVLLFDIVIFRWFRNDKDQQKKEYFCSLRIEDL